MVEFLAHDLEHWARAHDEPAHVVTAVRVLLTLVGMLVALVVLHLGVGYLNRTAFEMGAAVVVYVWLLLFIRTVSAAAEGPPALPVGPQGPAHRPAHVGR